MTRSLNKRSLVAGCLILALAGCGSKAASATTPPAKKAAPTATPRPTSVTPELTSYAQLTQPVLKSGITQAATLISQMNKTATNQLGRVCVQAAGLLSNNRDAFDQVPPPPTAKRVYNVAKQAYQLALASTDECGIASDANQAGQMAGAAQDLKRALGQMNLAESSLAAWAALH